LREKKKVSRKRPVGTGLFGERMAIRSFSYSSSEPIRKISQTKGLKDPECGCNFKPLSVNALSMAPARVAEEGEVVSR